MSAGVELEADFRTAAPRTGTRRARAPSCAPSAVARRSAPRRRAPHSPRTATRCSTCSTGWPAAPWGVGRSYEQLKVADLPDGYYVGALALALLLPAALSLLSYLAPDAAAAQRGRKSKAH